MPLKDWKIRFWAKVDKNGPTINAELGPCWLWRATLDKDGYGEFGSRGGPCDKETGEKKVHRISFVIANGIIPPGWMVLHKCDLSPCLNPEHLYRGDAIANAIDRERRNRRLSPSDYKVSLEDGEKIKQLYATGQYSYSVLGNMFGISLGQAHYIVTDPRWGGGFRHEKVVDPALKIDRLRSIHKLTEKQKSQLRSYFASGRFNKKQLARIFSISHSHACNIVQGRW